MKTIGIIGGMGPEATADLFMKILNETRAACDQEHIPVLIDSNTRIPDRTAAILSNGADPVPELRRSAFRLAEMGAEALVMGCNTAHYFYDAIIDGLPVPLLHMPRETATEIRKAGYRRVALLATSGTVQSGVYADAFLRNAPETRVLLPDAEGQEAVMGLIYDGVKAGNWAYPTDAARGAMQRLSERGAEAFVLGCTELPLAFAKFGFSEPTVDPTRVLARAAVRFSGAPLKHP